MFNNLLLGFKSWVHIHSSFFTLPLLVVFRVVFRVVIGVWSGPGLTAKFLVFPPEIQGNDDFNVLRYITNAVMTNPYQIS